MNSSNDFNQIVLSTEEFNNGSFIERFDALTGEQFKIGDHVCICSKCRAASLEDSWNALGSICPCSYSPENIILHPRQRYYHPEPRVTVPESNQISISRWFWIVIGTALILHFIVGLNSPSPSPVLKQSAEQIFQKARSAEIKREYLDAERLYRMAAVEGSSLAMYNLGIIYETGRLVTPSKLEALKWYRKAAARGNLLAKRQVIRLTGKSDVPPKLDVTPKPDVTPKASLPKLSLKKLQSEQESRNQPQLIIDQNLTGKKLVARSYESGRGWSLCLRRNGMAIFNRSNGRVDAVPYSSTGREICFDFSNGRNCRRIVPDGNILRWEDPKNGKSTSQILRIVDNC